ncbi:MAG: helix-turn-helix transcriptional regulator [Magnetococcales bacterium]|nr:helix-turn-helix transcriptional regulator [Magnetococcales bacterium]
MSTPDDPEKSNFAYRFRTARLHANLTQQSLAEKVGITQAAIHKLESGQFRSSRKTVAIAMVCQVNPVWLETGVGEMTHREEMPTEDEESRTAAVAGGVVAQLGAMERELERTIQMLLEMRNKIRRLRARQRARPRRTTAEG